MKFSLDSMAKQFLENVSTTTTEDNLANFKEKLQSTAANEKKLQRAIWLLETTPQSNAKEVYNLLEKWIYESAYTWTAEKDMKTWLIIDVNLYMSQVKIKSRQNYFNLARFSISFVF